MAANVSKTVLVQYLGKIPYLEGLAVQKALQRQHLDHIKENTSAKPSNTLLLCEHNPVYTVGIRNTVEHDVVNKLKSLGAEFYSTKRGGLITYHGPGQLVCYPILNLGDFRRSIRWYVERLEETLVKTCRKYGVEAGLTCDTGVWVGEDKIAAIGVKASRWVTMHGIALNCNTDLAWFDHIVPCGIEGKGVTSLTQETKRNISIREASEHFLNSFSEVFECDTRLANEHNQQFVYSES